MPTRPGADGRRLSREAGPVPRNRERESSGLLEDELLDVYAAIVIAVPVAYLVKSLWL
ncbi:hypothetical protein [Enhydrobacter aerosaccus]|nr:hypothetical protein [Enhydrobacter aerosaccus]